MRRRWSLDAISTAGSSPDAVVVTETASSQRDRVTAIGEAKGTLAPMDVPQLQRLEHLRALLPDDRVDGPPKLLLFARAGFTGELVEAARGRRDVELVDLHRLYARIALFLRRR